MKFLPRNSEPVPISSVTEEVEVEEEQPVRVARTVALAPWSETTMLFSTSPSRVVEVSQIQGAKEHLNHVTAFGSMNVFSIRLFKLVVADPSSTVITLA